MGKIFLNIGTLVLICCQLTGSGCTSNSLQRTVKTIQNTILPGEDVETAPALQIKHVLRTTLDPNKSFDIVGDGSGIMGTLCLPEPDDDGNTPAGSACACKFDYIKQNGAEESFETTVDYFEPNLLRCQFEGLPQDIPFVKVSVLISGTDQRSNEVIFPLQGLGTTGDPTNPLNFVPVKRYQCKDAVYIPNMLDRGDAPIYDPFLSESPEVSYPLNFHTTNMGGTLIQFVNKVIPVQGVGWICPPSDAVGLPWMDKRVFSIAPLEPANNNKIFPPDGNSFDRSNFLLAKKPVGVFTVPFNTVVAPELPSSSTADPLSIGFGARPFRLNDGEEVCPESTAIIPPGMKWVKVWQFRSSLEARTTVQSPLFQTLEVFCNPGLPINTSCNSTSNFSPTSLVDRLDSFTRCFAPGAGLGKNRNARPDSIDFNVADGTDRWTQKGGLVGCGQIGDDPLGFCQRGGTVPHNNVSVILKDLDRGGSRFDLLYVVSPVDIMTKHFQKDDPKALPFKPYRFYSPDQCLSEDGKERRLPSGKLDCEERKRVPYGFVTNNVVEQDPNPNIKLNPVFPMCVLQPKTEAREE